MFILVAISLIACNSTTPAAPEMVTEDDEYTLVTPVAPSAAKTTTTDRPLPGSTPTPPTAAKNMENIVYENGVFTGCQMYSLTQGGKYGVVMVYDSGWKPFLVGGKEVICNLNPLQLPPPITATPAKKAILPTATPSATSVKPVAPKPAATATPNNCPTTAKAAVSAFGGNEAQWSFLQAKNAWKYKWDEKTGTITLKVPKDMIADTDTAGQLTGPVSKSNIGSATVYCTP